MAILSRPVEQRAISPQALFRTGLDTYLSRNESGITVTTEVALTLSAYWRCVALLTGDISGLPGKAFREEPAANSRTIRVPLSQQPTWIAQPDPFDPSVTTTGHFAQVMVSLLTDSNAYTLAEPSVIEPDSLTVLPPGHVEPHKAGRFPEYHVRNSLGQVLGVYGPDQIIHVSMMRMPGAVKGTSILNSASEGIGLALAVQKYAARFFAQGALMPGFIEVPGDAQQTALDIMAADLAKRHKGWKSSGLLGFLTGGSKFSPTGINPKDADLTALSEFYVEEMARYFGIPAYMLSSQKPGAASYASVEQRTIDYAVHTLRHYIEPIEDAYSRLVPGDRRLGAPGSNTYFKFNLAGLLRGDIQTRYTAYGIGLDKGFLSIDDVRALEDMPPITKGGDVYRVLGQMVDVAAEPPEPVAPPTLVPDEGRALLPPIVIDSRVMPGAITSAPVHVDARIMDGAVSVDSRTMEGAIQMPDIELRAVEPLKRTVLDRDEAGILTGEHQEYVSS